MNYFSDILQTNAVSHTDLPLEHYDRFLNQYHSFFLRNGDSEKNGEYSLFRTLVPALKSVIDVGAFDTVYYVEQASPSTKLFLFEPHPVYYNKLLVNLESSCDCKGKQVETFPLGLSDTPENLPFYHNASSFVNRFQEEPSVVCRVDRLDSIPAITSLEEISFLKVDVEGYELNVLRGAAGILPKVRWIQFEYGGTYKDKGLKLTDVLSFLQEYGFQHFYYIGEGVLLKVNKTSTHDHYEYANIFASKTAI